MAFCWLLEGFVAGAEWAESLCRRNKGILGGSGVNPGFSGEPFDVLPQRFEIFDCNI
jgi:hypothetical protein